MKPSERVEEIIDELWDSAPSHFQMTKSRYEAKAIIQYLDERWEADQKSLREFNENIKKIT